jgi:carbon monoxide dehydrogenase subunit G
LKIEASVVIDCTAKDVWNFMTDLSNTPKWDPGVLEVKQTSSGPLGLNATLESKHPKRVMNERVVEYEPGQKFTLEFISGPIKGTKVSYAMENADGKTRLTRSLDVKLNGFYKLAALFVGRSAQKERDAEINNVKRILESKE